jgi:YfiH family protein
MTTSPSHADGVQTLPSASLTGMLTATVAYAFSDRSFGTMSATVGEGDHRRSRAALAAQVDIDPSRVSWMDQIHGDTVTVLDEPVAQPPRCDALVTVQPDVGVAVLAADCVPLLFATADGVAAAHAGRQGLVQDVVGATARRLGQLSTGPPQDVAVVIGPAIGPCCYEVPLDMVQQVDAVVPGTRGQTTWGSPSVDLVAGVVRQLHNVGIRRIARAGHCTRCGQDGRWFSHRASGGVQRRPPGRQAGIAVRWTRR